jgi:hypothetical protein
MELCYVLENAFILNKEYGGIVAEGTSIEINSEFLEKGKKKPISILFTSMLAD